MSYGPSKSSLYQTATNAAATLVAAGVTDTSDVEKIADVLFEKLVKVYEAEESTAPTGGGQTYSKSSGGGGGRKSQGNVGDIAFKGTKFSGKTIAEVYNMSAQEAFDNHGYADFNGNPQSGKKFITWLGDPKQDGFMANRCREFLAQKTATPSKDNEFDFSDDSWRR